MENPLEVLPDLVKENEKKIVLLVLDGLGGLPYKGKTALEAAVTPNMDKLVSLNECGLLDPVFPGITPGSGPAHLSLFGYDPLKYQIGRGILEALGVGMEVRKGDLTARGNFCIIKDGRVTDRRAGRLDTEINREIVDLLNREIQDKDNVEIFFRSGLEHRFVLRLRGKGLNDEVSDTDPHTAGEELKKCEVTSLETEGAEKTARLINEITRDVQEILKGEDYPPNCIVLRGISGYPDLPQFPDVYKIRARAIANYPMYRGLAELVGMNVDREPETPEEEIKALKNSYRDFDYFYVHIKKIDSYGEDGNFEAKVGKIEEADSMLPEILELSPDVLAITGDHSTPATYRSHSWHPVPFLLQSQWTRISGVSAFNEKECAIGNLGRIPALYLTSMLLAHSERLDKFGA